MLKPSQHAVDAVKTWLLQSEVSSTDVKDDGEWINFHATIAQAEALMSTSFQRFRRSDHESQTTVRTLEYRVPTHLRDLIHMIQPTTRFTRARPRMEKAKRDVAPTSSTPLFSNGTSCDKKITPDCLRNLYNISGYTPSSNRNKTGFMAITGFLQQSSIFSDLTTFETSYAPWARGANFSWTSIIGT